jgi:hypothetical protein
VNGNTLHKSDDDYDDNNDYINKNDIKMDLQEVGCGTWTGSMWFRIGTCCGHLLMR